MLLSIDPSSTEVGWAVFNVALVDYGIIRATRVKRRERFTLIVEALNAIFNKYGVHEIACERPFISREIRAEALSVAFQCIKEWAKDRGTPIFIYSPGTWKSSVIGNHMADKEEVASIIYLQYPNMPRDLPSHVTDAIAIGLHREGIKKWERLAQRELYSRGGE